MENKLNYKEIKEFIKYYWLVLTASLIVIITGIFVLLITINPNFFYLAFSFGFLGYILLIISQIQANNRFIKNITKQRKNKK